MRKLHKKLNGDAEEKRSKKKKRKNKKSESIRHENREMVPKTIGGEEKIDEDEG